MTSFGLLYPFLNPACAPPHELPPPRTGMWPRSLPPPPRILFLIPLLTFVCLFSFGYADTLSCLNFMTKGGFCMGLWGLLFCSRFYYDQIIKLYALNILRFCQLYLNKAEKAENKILLQSPSSKLRCLHFTHFLKSGKECVARIHFLVCPWGSFSSLCNIPTHFMQWLRKHSVSIKLLMAIESLSCLTDLWHCRF